MTIHVLQTIYSLNNFEIRLGIFTVDAHSSVQNYKETEQLGEQSLAKSVPARGGTAPAGHTPQPQLGAWPCPHTTSVWHKHTFLNYSSMSQDDQVSGFPSAPPQSTRETSDPKHALQQW